MKNEDEVHFEGQIHQNAIITTNEGHRVLMVRDPNDQELWELPGGRLNLGEEPIDGLRRELREELGIEVEVGSIYHTQFLWHERSQKQHFLVMYEVFVPSEKIGLTLDPAEVAETRWIDRESYKNVKMYDDSRQSLEVYFKR